MSGINNADKPRMKNILNTFDPMMFPIIISDSFFRKAVMVTISSGSDVPTAMTVNAIKNEGIPSAEAMETVDPINNHAPKTIPTIPKMIKRRFLRDFSIQIVSMFYFCCFAHRMRIYNDPIKKRINNPPPIK